MNFIEQMMADVSSLFLAPVLIVLALMFLYALYELGRFSFELIMQKLSGQAEQPLGYFWNQNPELDQQEIELYLLKKLEPLRLVSRIAPMLGLVATMIPMGPALMAVASGNFMDVANNLTVAFAAVIIALMSASITFWILSVRRRWLLEELKTLVKNSAEQPISPQTVTA
ncbi:MotA/TolQ/ExbB proton channel family protein [Thiomicrorhabdus sp.]|uniref:MotA/TolQ/ExbB proton channel family protein n=1 Tax=Thiomicrorhabdus sp. TaxID=2039724 RepID=UPI002AA71053|nr:MotA/TolQ/ExbB proton channel family protein [Thiomicrorhabdus sp.]